MFSRRILEALACGTLETIAMEKTFKNYCYLVSSKSEMDLLIKRTKTH